MNTVVYRKHRKLNNLVVAKLKTDTVDTLDYEPEIRRIAGLAELTSDSKVSTDKSYYDDESRLIIDDEEDPTLKLKMSALSLEDKMWLYGQSYDSEGNWVSEEPGVERPYFAVGYITGDTDGKLTYTWIFKGKFGNVSESYKTKQGTETTDDEVEYYPIPTNHIFAKTKKNARSFKVVVTPPDGIDKDTFFGEVYDVDKYTKNTDTETVQSEDNVTESQTDTDSSI